MTDTPPRADEPAPPPPGTVSERWWQRSAFKAMLATVTGLWLPILDSYIQGAVLSRAALAASTTGSIVALLAALGVMGVDRGGLRRA